MLFCFAPFPLPPALAERLREVGIEAWEAPRSMRVGTDAPPVHLCLYDSPERVLQHWRFSREEPPSLAEVVQRFQMLLSQVPGSLLISVWRLQQLDLASLSRWLSAPQGEASFLQVSASEPPVIDPQVAPLMLSLLQDNPAFLESYLDLELQGELAGTLPDSHYLERLQACASSAALFASWWSLADTRAECETLLCRLAEREARHQDALAEAALTLGQLHQVQEELERLFLRSQELEQRLAQQEATLQTAGEEREALQAASQALSSERDSLTSALADSEARSKAAQEEGELTLLQLHQVQEELERYFLLSREQGQLLDRMDQQQQHALKLLAQPSPRPGVSPRQGKGTRTARP